MATEPTNTPSLSFSAASLTVALAGNPNCGKTTIFNSLTGTRQHVGNYPGVTVEKKEGECRYGDLSITLVDLPGTYSLTAYSVEELVARDFIIHEKPDVVVDVLDASNLERNLYLGVQLIELDVPLLFALNMSDVAHNRGIKFDLDELSRFLGAPIVPTVGHRDEGTEALLEAVIKVHEEGTGYPPAHIHYGREIEEELEKIVRRIKRENACPTDERPRWAAIKLLEEDDQVVEQVQAPAVHRVVRRSMAHLTEIFGDPPRMVIPDRRYGFISGACQETVQSTVESRHNVSDRIDTILLNRLLGLPIFLGLMYLVFQLTFSVGEVPMRWLEAIFGWLGTTIAGNWPTGAESPLCSLIVDGIIGGVGGVVSFVPNIMLLFLAIAVLEDSGYMARAAFIVDQIMHRIGLHGKSFIPMLIGFGCSVPGIMATRTLENRRDRLTTIMITPLMSCGARLPIYALIIPAFFPSRWHGPMLWTIYVIGILTAIVAAKILRMTVLKGETTPFVMELPPYRVPTLRGSLIHMWERSWLYLKKAGTIILGFSILLWALTTYPRKTEGSPAYEAQLFAAQAAHDTRLAMLSTELGAKLTAEELDAAFATGTLPEAPGTRRDFIELCLRIRNTRGHYAELSREAAQNGDEAHVIYVEHRRDDELKKLAAGAFELYGPALSYLDDIRAPFEREIHALEAARRADELMYTVAGRIGRALEPALKPIGFDWRIGTALVGAFAAKEIFVAQLGIVFAVGDDNENADALRLRLQRAYSPLVGFCIMLFCLISLPCVATIAVTKRETNSWGWALGQLAGLTAIAYLVTLAAYQLGSLLGFGV